MRRFKTLEARFFMLISAFATYSLIAILAFIIIIIFIFSDLDPQTAFSLILNISLIYIFLIVKRLFHEKLEGVSFIYK